MKIQIKIVLLITLIRTNIATKFNSEEIEGILDLHNNYRRFVQPAAANMQLMRWSKCLENVAHNYLSTCPGFNHNQNRNSQAQALGCEGSENYIGENLYWYSEYISNNSIPVEAWYDEFQYYDVNSLSCSYICGHYTQIVWATTDLVGCAKYDASTYCNGDSGTYYICNYAPGGNTYFTSPYEVGDLCSNCEDGYDYCVYGLCSKTSESGSLMAFSAYYIVLMLLCIVANISSYF